MTLVCAGNEPFPDQLPKSSTIQHDPVPRVVSFPVRLLYEQRLQGVAQLERRRTDGSISPPSRNRKWAGGMRTLVCRVSSYFCSCCSRLWTPCSRSLTLLCSWARRFSSALSCSCCALISSHAFLCCSAVSDWAPCGHLVLGVGVMSNHRKGKRRRR